MPFHYVQRYAPSGPAEPSTRGVQIVEGTLTFDGATNIVLNNTVYNTTENYVLFQYGTLSIPSVPGTYATNDAALAALVTANTAFSDPNSSLSVVDSITDDALNSRILLNLKSNPRNGTQYIGGNLDITGSMTMVLAATLYATAQTYILFDVAGTVTGIGNISIVPPAGRSVSGSVFTEAGGLGTLVKVTLV